MESTVYVTVLVAGLKGSKNKCQQFPRGTHDQNPSITLFNRSAKAG